MSKLIQNAVYCKDTDKYYTSRHRHEFVRFDSGGKTGLYIDGGCEYVRSTVMPDTVIDWCLYDDSPFEEIKTKLLWGTNGKNGDQPTKWIPLFECETEHLQNILKTQFHIKKETQELIKAILVERGVQPVEVPCFDDLPALF